MTSSSTDNLPAEKQSAAGSSALTAPKARAQRVPEEPIRVGSSRALLLNVLRNPGLLATLTLRQWDVLLRLARQTGLAARIAVEIRTRGGLEQVPAEVRPHLKSALVVADRHECVVRWELNRMGHALSEAEIPGPLVLLKGAAYIAAGLPVAQGRISSDIDLLAPKEQLDRIEQQLLRHGYLQGGIDARDARYFRTWLHELPPLIHRRRKTVLDIHHTILPRTDRLQVDPARLIADSVPVAGSRFRVLAPADMFLHSAAHLFRNGDFTHAVRDLLDLDGLARSFSQRPDFWRQLIQRAELHELSLPCYCGLRFANRYFSTPLGEEIQAAMNRWRPGGLRLAVIDSLVDRALLPRQLDRRDPGRDRAVSLLAHWPVPRLRAMLTSLFWTKRLPRWRREQWEQEKQARAEQGPARPE